MAIFPLTEQFLETHQQISLGDREMVAIAAHVEVRDELHKDRILNNLGLDDILVGSYARKVSIWPGKDVDVLGRLMLHTTGSLTPDQAYGAFERALARYRLEGRLTCQPRSLKVSFGPNRVPMASSIRAAAIEYGWETERVNRVIGSLGQLAFEFSVDVVPAVQWGDHYGIPDLGVDPSGMRIRSGTWQVTSPVDLTHLTAERNRDPRIGGVGAFVRTVKSFKQIKTHHLPDGKPSSLYYEFILHEGFAAGHVRGDHWADLTASALSYVAGRLGTVAAHPVCDPVLGEAYRPAPGVADLHSASAKFEELARRARRAVATTDRCQAAIEWRNVFGGNGQYDLVFPIPQGCRGTGVAMGAAAVNVSSGGTEERSFGTR